MLKNEGRIEALFTLYFLALLLQALIERELRRAMARQGIPELPLCPEERHGKPPACNYPSCEEATGASHPGRSPGHSQSKWTRVGFALLGS